MSAKVAVRYSGDTVILDVSGRITAAEGPGVLREQVRELVAGGQRRIVLNMAGVTFMDSSGIGELTSSYVAVTHEHGQCRLCELTKRIRDLFQMTRLYQVLEIYEGEQDAIVSFR